MAYRTAVALKKALDSELLRLSRLDDENRSRFNWPTFTGTKRTVQRAQLAVLTEGVFLASFRAYELFLGDLFLLYCCGGNTASGRIVGSYLSPRSPDHARQLIQSSMRFLEWNNPDEIIRRAESYLKKGFPVKDPIAKNLALLHDARRIRNHIAHGTKDSKHQYIAALRNHLSIVPSLIPKPGDFLLAPSKKDPVIHNLKFFIETFSQVGRLLAH